VCVFFFFFFLFFFFLPFVEPTSGGGENAECGLGLSRGLLCHVRDSHAPGQPQKRRGLERIFFNNSFFYSFVGVLCVKLNS